MRFESIRPLLLALVLVPAGSCALPDARADGRERCVPVGAWVDPASGGQRDDVISEFAGRSVVLLGESHDEAEDHRWQLHTISALHGRRSDMALGFEMFPRRLQPVLDRWVAGSLSESDFLREVGWAEVWRIDAELYLPLFHFARMQRLKMLALNVDRQTTRRIAAEGLAAVPAAEREGVSEPAAASPAYRARLLDTFRQHAKGETAGPESEQFRHFVEAQLFWDRAMAEAIAAARRNGRGKLVVGIMGRGHVEYRDGVAHQLAALGVADVATALPWHAAADCRELDPHIADAVFGVDPPEGDDEEAAANEPASPPR